MNWGMFLTILAQVVIVAVVIVVISAVVIGIIEHEKDSKNG